MKTLKYVTPLLAVLVGCVAPLHESAAVDSSESGLVLHPLDLRKGTGDEGVQALIRLVGDARVVLLGEAWHGDGGAIRVRSEIVRILHEAMGFDILAFEADFFSLHRGWQDVLAGGDLNVYRRDNLYHFWGRSKASDRLWSYVDEQRSGSRPLHITGIDPRHTGTVAQTLLPAEIDRRLAEIGSDPGRRERLTSRLVQFLQDDLRNRPPPEEQDEFLTTLDLITSTPAQNPASPDEEFWNREILNLRNAVLYAWRGQNRDRFMGENLAWLASRGYPDKKIIVWAHNNHIIKDKWMYFASPDTFVTKNPRPLDYIARSTYLGDEAQEYFGPSVVSIGVLSHSGRYSADVRTENLREVGDFELLGTITPTPPGTIESEALSNGGDVVLVDLRRSSRSARAARALDYSQLPPLWMNYSEGFDSFLVIRETFGLEENPPIGWSGESEID